jgi:hypothetical protein
MNYAVTCPEAIRAELHKAHNREIWEQEAWKQKAAIYCATASSDRTVNRYSDVT